MVRVCFVCLGNICRSPTAEAVMRDLVAKAGLSSQIEVDSAGTGDWHVGHRADPRSIAAGARRGFALIGRARQFVSSDWREFDYVLPVDGSNYETLVRGAPSGAAGTKLRLLRSFDPASPPGATVPDPYYSEDGFDEVLDQCVAACTGLLAHLVATHGLTA
ncbi:MAG TPA: low molecular weight protein-tyrosine-phosphatase [Polyangiaceae bacterium]|nr:low molecular weight protein-tyrosine-phosphatase [Polyangiaceae bacterium]